jgi:hypothetical protein
MLCPKPSKRNERQPGVASQGDRTLSVRASPGGAVAADRKDGGQVRTGEWARGASTAVGAHSRCALGAWGGARSGPAPIGRSGRPGGDRSCGAADRGAIAATRTVSAAPRSAAGRVCSRRALPRGRGLKRRSMAPPDPIRARPRVPIVCHDARPRPPILCPTDRVALTRAEAAPLCG